jgi:hypothetical protein
MQRLIICALFAVLPAAGCATYWQVQDLEEKVDRLVQNTNRATMNQLFGEQATTITQKMETLSSEEQQKIDALLASYDKGSTSLEEVRAAVLGTMGGNDRVVSNPRGIWVRTEEGKRAQAIGNNTKLKNSQLVPDAELPVMITQNKALAGFRWGRAELNGRQVLFPWELTMSAFTKEIVENTARRTAQEFLKMAGDKAWNRPVQIQVVTEAGQNLRVTTPETEAEVFVITGSEEKVPEQKEEK